MSECLLHAYTLCALRCTSDCQSLADDIFSGEGYRGVGVDEAHQEVEAARSQHSVAVSQCSSVAAHLHHQVHAVIR